MDDGPNGFPSEASRNAISCSVTKKRLKRPIPKGTVKHNVVQAYAGQFPVELRNTTLHLYCWSGGESGIRTRDTVSRIHTFQACAFNHSATSPRACHEGVRADLQGSAGVSRKYSVTIWRSYVNWPWAGTRNPPNRADGHRLQQTSLPSAAAEQRTAAGSAPQPHALSPALR